MYVTLKHKTSHKCLFWKWKFGWHATIGKSGKVVQIKFLAMHITTQKCCFYIFTLGNLQNGLMKLNFFLIFLLFSYYFYYKKYNLDPYNVCLAISKNSLMQQQTSFVVQGHICYSISGETKTKNWFVKM